MAVLSLLILSIPLPTAHAESTKTVRIQIKNPLDLNGIIYTIVEDVVSVRLASQDIKGYATDGTPLGDIGKAFFYYEAATLTGQILLDGNYTLEKISVEHFRSPEVRNNTLELGILLLIEFSSPEVSLGYASTDLVLTLATGQGTDQWVIKNIDSVGTYANTFIKTLPDKFRGAETWIKNHASDLWHRAKGVGPCAGMIVPVFGGVGLFAYSTKRRALGRMSSASTTLENGTTFSETVAASISSPVPGADAAHAIQDALLLADPSTCKDSSR